jgi:hypothetical protein
VQAPDVDRRAAHDDAPTGFGSRRSGQPAEKSENATGAFRSPHHAIASSRCVSPKNRGQRSFTQRVTLALQKVRSR